MPHQCTNCDRTFPDGSKEMLTGCPECGGNKFQFAPAAPSGGPPGSTDRAGGTERDRPRPPGSTPGNGDSSTPGGTSPGHGDSGVPGGPSPGHGDSGVPGGTSAPIESDCDARSNSSSSSFPDWPETARPPTEGSDSDASASDAAGESATGGEWPSSSSPDRPARTNRPASEDRSNRPASEESNRPRAAEKPTAEEENAAQADARSEVVSPDELPPSAAGDSPAAGGDARSDSGVVDVDVNDRPEGGRVVSEPTGERPSLDELREELNQQFESIKIVRPGQYELNLMELYDREEYIVSLQEDGRYVIDVPDSWRGSDD